MNDKVYTFKDNGWSIYSIKNSDSSQTYFHIDEFNPENGNPWEMRLGIFNSIKNGIGSYSMQHNIGYGCAGFGNYQNSVYYGTDNYGRTGTIEIPRFDTINGIVSGRFSFTGAKLALQQGFNDTSNIGYNSPDNNIIIKITSGRFDLKFRRLHYQ